MDPTRRLFAAQMAGAFVFSTTLGSGQAWAGAPALARSVRLSQSGPAVRLSIGLDRPTSARVFFLENPSRFVVDLEQARWALPSGQAGQGAGLGVVSGYRYAMRPEGAARLVLDLQGGADLVRQQAPGRGGAPEFCFDLAARAPLAPPPRVIERSGRSGARRVVVIDAGHGGRDPGAIGVTGVREKDVVLDAAMQLRDALESRGDYRVALTRESDSFVPLEQRVSFARGQNADLFISLHADSHANREARGASIYTLSERGADRAQAMMGAHNWDIDLGDAPRVGMVGDILVDLAQRETTNRSAHFAQVAIDRLAPVAPLLRNTHRSAGFFVLLAPDVPAVLMEMGFLSNPADEQRLADPGGRRRMAEAMAGAIDSYFAAPRTYLAGA